MKSNFFLKLYNFGLNKYIYIVNLENIREIISNLLSKVIYFY